MIPIYPSRSLSHALILIMAVVSLIDPGLYYYDMIMTLDAVTERVWFGTIRVTQGVTR